MIRQLSSSNLPRDYRNGFKKLNRHFDAFKKKNPMSERTVDWFKKKEPEKDQASKATPVAAFERNKARTMFENATSLFGFTQKSELKTTIFTVCVTRR